jgi:uncharacterized membrane protein YsdA (DUF1294 family)
MDILTIIISLVALVVFFGICYLSFIVSRWSLKWMLRTVKLAVFIFLIILFVNIFVLNVLIPIMNKYLLFNALGRNYIAFGIIAIGCGIISYLVTITQKLAKKSQDLKRKVNEAKKAKNSDEERYYLLKKAPEDSWYFSLYSIIVFVVYLIVQALILDFAPVIFSKLISISNFDQVLITSFFLFIGLILLILISISRSKTFKFYGKILVLTNIVAMIFFSLVLYEDFIDQLPSMRNIYFASLSETDSPVGAMTLILIIYFSCVNISAFFSYGYDSGFAWLFEDETDEYRRNSTIKVGSHWIQRLVRFLLEQIARIIYKDEYGRKEWIKSFKANRMDEFLLHWHSVLGGTIGAFAGHKFFNHKKIFGTNMHSASPSVIKFAPVFKSIFYCQLCLLAALVYIGRS